MKNSNASCGRGYRLLAVTAMLVVLFAGANPARAQSRPAVDAGIDVANEVAVVTAAHGAAKNRQDATADAGLLSGLDLNRKGSGGAHLARRVAGVCGWLQNENDYVGAVRLARRTVDRLARVEEGNDAERVERLYWEARLEGYVLDNKARALELLQLAEKLAPDDPRIVEDALRHAQALAEFGR